MTTQITGRARSRPVLGLRIVALVGGVFAALTADAKPPVVSAPGGMALGQTVDEATGPDGSFFYGNTCYGERAVSGAVVTPGGLAHVMGCVDRKTQTIEAIEVDFVRQVAAADLERCRVEVRRAAQALFSHTDWQESKVRTFFLGGADRTHISVNAEDIRYEVWGDFETVIGPICTISWRVATGGRTFDAKRIPAF